MADNVQIQGLAINDADFIALTDRHIVGIPLPAKEFVNAGPLRRHLPECAKILSPGTLATVA
jgi:hypothetical protein